jgi:hypothetical protein
VNCLFAVFTDMRHGVTFGYAPEGWLGVRF